MPAKCYEFKSLGLKTNFETKKYSKIKHSTDRLFEERVRQYIIENKHKCFIDADSLVYTLRHKYPEYMRKQKAAVKYSAGRVIAKLCEESFESDSSSKMAVEPIASDSDPPSNLSNISSDDELSTTNNSTPSINDTLADLYKTSNSNVSQDEEFINISSDENIEESDSSCSTITIDDQPVNNPDATPSPAPKKRKHDQTEPNASTSTQQIPSTNGSIKTDVSRISNKRKKHKGRQSQMRNRKAGLDLSKMSKSIATDDALSANNIPSVTLSDIAGYENVISDVVRLMLHIYHPEIYNHLKIDPPRGFLLHGPPGCGKTLLAHAVAGELKIPLIDIAAPELVAGVSGISEQRIRKLFENTIKLSPCVLFIDEIDCITQNRDIANRDMERRIVSQLLSSLDKLNRDPKGAQVLIIGATNRPDSLDPALRRAGRFDREVCMGIPSLESRYEILQLMCSKLRLSEDVCLREIASYTPGYVGADLLSLIRESALSAVHRVIEKIQSIQVLPNKNEGQIFARMLSNDIETIKSISDNSVNEKSNKNDSIVELKENSSQSIVKVNETENNIVVEMKEKKNGNISEITERKNTIVEMNVTTNKSDSTRDTLKQSLSWIRNKLPIKSEYLENVFITPDDFKIALKRVQPSSKREGFATIPNVTWDDIGSLKDIREALQMTILAPVKYPKHFLELGLSTSTGVLLCGPPGCGKTLLAKAVANEAGINFLSVKGPELLNMYVGSSEKAVRECFQRAKNSQPCVIFFDELDALCPKRSDNSENSAGMRVVNQLLTEMDGVEGRSGVFLMAATNRPDIIDPAVLRPGRLDKILYVGFPNEVERIDILRAITKNGRKPRFSGDVNLADIAKNPLCEGFTGADLSALVRDASMLTLKEMISSCKNDNDTSPVLVTAKHFEHALQNLRPSVSEKDRKHYEQLRKKFAASTYQLQKNDDQDVLTSTSNGN